MIKNIAVSAVVALIVSIGVAGLIGGNQSGDNLGAAGTRFQNGISTDSTSPTRGQIRGTTLTVTGAQTFGTSGATTSISVGKVCYTITSATGTVFYASYNGAGALATSTTSCN